MAKRRKPMSEEQRAAAAERLKLAREKRMKENPPQYKNVHPNVLALPEDATLSFKNVRQWIKTQKELASRYTREDRQGVKGALAKAQSAKGYISEMENYLKYGDWISGVYGEYGQTQMKWVCIANAYYDNGMPKRSIGVFYKDIGAEWTPEMDVEYREKLARMDKEPMEQEVA
jgi:hypothetical protein